jgi:hypothetical protein
VQLEQTQESLRDSLEAQLRTVLTKLEVKLHVRDYANEKVAHYATLSERLGVELRELLVTKKELETKLRTIGSYSIIQ